MFKLQVLLLSYLLFYSTFTQQTYFGAYGTSGETCCPIRIATTNEKVNWSKNFILNGDFENPKLPDGKIGYTYDSIPHWTTSGKFQLMKGLHDEDLLTQYLELDPG